MHDVTRYLYRNHQREYASDLRRIADAPGEALPFKELHRQIAQAIKREVDLCEHVGTIRVTTFVTGEDTEIALFRRR